MKTHSITQARAFELLNYDPSTGIFTWKISQGKAKAGSIVGTVQRGYRKTTIDREQIRIHRLAWFMTKGEWPKGQIDHINGNKDDNRIDNLRDVPMFINMQNRYESRKKSGLPQGVSHAWGGRFYANIRLGTFDSAEEASAAYKRAKLLVHVGCSHHTYSDRVIADT